MSPSVGARLAWLAIRPIRYYGAHSGSRQCTRAIQISRRALYRRRPDRELTTLSAATRIGGSGDSDGGQVMATGSLSKAVRGVLFSRPAGRLPPASPGQATFSGSYPLLDGDVIRYQSTPRTILSRVSSDGSTRGQYTGTSRSHMGTCSRCSNS